MNLWNQWYDCVNSFQVACARHRTHVFLVLVLVGFSIRPECAGVTSFIRALVLEPPLYQGFLHFFNTSTSLDLAVLTRIWHAWVRQRLPVLRVGPYPVYVADGLKVAKEGKKMPAVKKLHQASENNSKAAFIRGHSFQALAVLVGTAGGTVAAIPLVSRIHEGVVWFPGDRRSLLDKLASLFLETVAPESEPALLVADAYYASRKVILPLVKQGHQLLTRVRRNAVAYHPAPPASGRPKGRPRKYGAKVKLNSYFSRRERFVRAPSPVYGKARTEILYYAEELFWRPIGRLVRLVWVIHPTRGKLILMCTDRSLDSLDIIRTCGYRFKIEVSFRQAIHGVGTYAYHFWLNPENALESEPQGLKKL